MLVLSRQVNETIRIGDNICIKVLSSHDNQVRLGISAPNTYLYTAKRYINSCRQKNARDDKNTGVASRYVYAPGFISLQSILQQACTSHRPHSTRHRSNPGCPLHCRLKAYVTNQLAAGSAVDAHIYDDRARQSTLP